MKLIFLPIAFRTAKFGINARWNGPMKGKKHKVKTHPVQK